MEWAGPEYDLLSQNCIHFCKELLKRLGVMTPFPSWISQLAQTMQNLRKESHGAAQAIADLDRIVAQQLKMAGHYIGGECGLCGPAPQSDGGGWQGDETLLQDLVLPQESTEDEAFICPHRWLLCESENGFVGLHSVQA